MSTNAITIRPYTHEYLYHRYAGQMQPQPLYLYLDADGTAYCDWDGEIGNVFNCDIYNGADLRWRIGASALTQCEIEELLEQAAPLLERVHAGHDVGWRNGNWSGTLDDDARAASYALDDLCRDAGGDVSVYDINDWVTEDWYPAWIDAGRDWDALADVIKSYADSDSIVDGDGDDLAAMWSDVFGEMDTLAGAE